MARLGTMNPSARIFEAAFGEVDVDELFRPDGAGAHAPFLAGEPGELHDTGETHSVSVTFDGPIDWTEFGIWFSMLLNARGEEVLRVKALRSCGEAAPFAPTGVHPITPPPAPLGEGPAEDRRSRIVFITKRIRPEELLESLLAFRGLLGARALPL